MLDRETINITKRYLAALPAQGIHPSHAIIFGSHARGNTDEWSDTDVLIVAPEFDNPRPISWSTINKLWDAAQDIDPRLEPIPCGAKEWQRPHARPVPYAEAEGFEVAA